MLSFALKDGFLTEDPEGGIYSDWDPAIMLNYGDSRYPFVLEAGNNHPPTGVFKNMTGRWSQYLVEGRWYVSFEYEEDAVAHSLGCDL